jgi:hypothetical protein
MEAKIQRGPMPRYIDPTVEHVGVSKLRQLNVTNLSNFEKMLVVQDNDKPLVVVVNYREYLEAQEQHIETREKLKKALETIQMYQSGAHGVQEGLKSAIAGNVTPLSEIDPDL